VSDTDSAIEVRALTKRYGEYEAVRGIDISVRRGEVFGLLGPNGAGKTTTLRMLTTLLRPTAGTATVAGADLLADPARCAALRESARQRLNALNLEGAGDRLVDLVCALR